MSIGIVIFGIIGFFISLFIMYRTEHGIPGIKKYDSNFRLLDMRFRYNSEILYNTLGRIGENGMKLYRNFLFLDFFFIACFLIVMLFITQKVTTINIFIFILSGFAISRSIFDMLENISLITLINMYPTKNIVFANFCSLATTFKFISLYLWIAGIVISLILKLI